MKRLLFIVPIVCVLGSTTSRPAARASDVRLAPDAAKRQVAVSIDGKPFTTYCYGPAFEDKPVFYPVISPNGALPRQRSQPARPGVWRRGLRANLRRPARSWVQSLDIGRGLRLLARPGNRGSPEP